MPPANPNGWREEETETGRTGDAENEPESGRNGEQEGHAFVVRIQQPFVTLGGIEEQFEVDSDGVKRRVAVKHYS